MVKNKKIFNNFCIHLNRKCFKLITNEFKKPLTAHSFGETILKLNPKNANLESIITNLKISDKTNISLKKNSTHFLIT